MLKKLICLMLACAMLAAVPAKADAQTAEKDGLEYAEVLAQLGIIDGFSQESYKPEKNVTYSELASAVAAFIEYPGEDVFGMIGISKGADGSSCTVGTVLECLLRAMGYEEYVSQKYPFENGYLILANRLGIFKSAAKADEELVYSDFAEILYNALEVSPYIFNSVLVGPDGEGVVNYTKYKNQTALYYFKNIYTVEGVLTDNTYISLYGDGSLGENRIIIDGVQYGCDFVTDSYIGKYITAYIKEDPDKKLDKAVCIKEESNRNEVLKVAGEDMLSFNMLTKNFEYFRENGKRATGKMESSAAVIYNNGGMKNYGSDIFTGIHGTITFIDNNRNGIYDAAIIEDAEPFLVGGVYVADKTVYNLLSYKGATDKLTLDENDGEIKCRFIKNGKEAAFEDIAYGNLLKVLDNTNNTQKYITVYISDQYAEGKIDAVSGDYESVTVNGEVYEVSKLYKEMTALGEKYAPKFAIGEAYVVYLDFEGKVVAASTDFKNANKIGYLYGAASDGVFDMDNKVKIFESNGKWTIYELKDYVEFNSDKRKKAETVIDALRTSGKQMISYRVNNDGKITALYTKDAPADKFTITDLGSQRYSNGTYLTFGGVYYINKGSTIFFIPSDEKESEFSVLNISNLPTATTYNNVVSYNIDEYNASSYFSIKGDDNYKNIRHTSANLFLIDEVSKALDLNGETVTRISGVTGSFTYYTMDMSDEAEGMDLITNKSITSGDLKEGDVITFVINPSGQISNFRRRYSIASKASMPSPSPNTIGVSYGGRVTAIDREARRLKLNSNGTELILGIRDASVFYMYDTGVKKGIKTNISKFDDLQVDDYIFARADYGSVNEMIIYK